MTDSTVTVFKVPFETKHFNVNQKVWVRQRTGAMAAHVCGRFRGDGRYISAWVNWDRADKIKYPAPIFINVSVNTGFARRHCLQAA